MRVPAMKPTAGSSVMRTAAGPEALRQETHQGNYLTALRVIIDLFSRYTCLPASGLRRHLCDSDHGVFNCFQEIIKFCKMGEFRMIRYDLWCAPEQEPRLAGLNHGQIIKTVSGGNGIIAD